MRAEKRQTYTAEFKREAGRLVPAHGYADCRSGAELRDQRHDARSLETRS